MICRLDIPLSDDDGSEDEDNDKMNKNGFLRREKIVYQSMPSQAELKFFCTERRLER